MTTSSADALTHRTLQLSTGVRIHAVEQGEGPLVLLVHGFPESWRSWRQQLPALAAAGYRAVAIDVRGYGRSSKPADVAAYRMLELVDDSARTVQALGADTAVIVGHDWGSPIAATSALLHPEIFTAVGLLSVPYTPPRSGGPRPTEIFAQVGGEDLDFYVDYFQEPGRAEREIEPDVRGWLQGVYTTLSGDHDGKGTDSVFFLPAGHDMRERFSTAGLPDWLDEAELDAYVGEFERGGLTAPLNRYRNVDRDFDDLKGWADRPIPQPAIFIGGELDATTSWLGAAIEAHPQTLTGLVTQELLPGVGHWVQQEAPERVNALLIDWLGQVAS